MKDTLPVVEIFGPTIQGEGFLVGKRTMFLRLGYCDGAGGDAGWCRWCDSMHAVDPKNAKNWKQLTVQEIRSELLRIGPQCRQLTISGGNPAIHDLEPLIRELGEDYWINIETQGTIFRPWMMKLDTITVSPKPPSSGADPEENLARLESFLDNIIHIAEDNEADYIPPVCVKIPVDMRIHNEVADYDFAIRAFRLTRERDSSYEWMSFSCFLSMVTYPDDTNETLIERYRELVEQMCDDEGIGDVSVIPQLHVLLWGHRLGV